MRRKATTGPRSGSTPSAVMREVSARLRGRACLALSACALCTAALGNEPPRLSIHVGGNASFVWAAEPIRYIVVASDAEDGDSLSGGIDPYSVAVELRYVADGDSSPEPEIPETGAVIGAIRGKALVEGGDCLLCHSERADGPTAIPTYAAIAAKFQGNLSVAPALAYNIVNGSQGIWGTILMPAHSVTPAEADAMALYVLSFASSAPDREFLPIAGNAVAPVAQRRRPGPFGAAMPGRFVLTAVYSDRGGADEAPQVGRASVELRDPNVLAGGLTPVTGFERVDDDGMALLVSHAAGAQARLDAVDLTDIRSIGIATVGSARRWPGGSLELRADAPDGELLGTFDTAAGGRRPEIRRAAIRLEPRRGRHDLYLIATGAAPVAIGAICFECGY